MTETSDHEALAWAIELVDEVMNQHNFKPTPKFRGKAVLSVYQQVRKLGHKKAKPRLEDLILLTHESD